MPLGSAAAALLASAGALPDYSGPKPPWPYRGYESFPSHFFGANESGPENAAELALLARHQFVGWGWQQGDSVTPTADDGHYYNEETASAQAATRFASFLEFSAASPKRTQGIFVYRHSQMALSWYTVQRAAYNNSANDDFWMKGADGKTCVDSNRGGPAWNFSNPRAADFFVDEVIGELTREADINSVFFDETDYEYCGGSTCHGQHLGQPELAQLYRAKLAVLRRTAIKLNAAGIWPMFSSVNEVDGGSNLPHSRRRCPLPYTDYFDALKDVGWFRFYEFFGPSSLKTFLQEVRSGLPVVVHAPGNMKDNLALATFLLGQGDYSYFGTSNGWTDGGWNWHPEYDVVYGKPLGAATQNASGWSREFSRCSVFLNTAGTNATIAMRSTEEVVATACTDLLRSECGGKRASVFQCADCAGVSVASTL